VKISIITVCFNSAATIAECIESVLVQTCSDVEYIVVDGNSNDGTKEIIQRYLPRISHFISEPDSGIYDAMNKGLALATGDIVGILNSDDIYKKPDVLERIVALFQNDQECICTDVEIFENSPENVIRYYSCTTWKPWMFRIGHQPPHPGFFAKKDCYLKWGNFNTKFKLAADFDLLMRFIFKNKAKTEYHPWVSVSMRSGGASQKGLRNISRSNREVNQSIKGNGYYSNILLVWMKYILKIFQFTRQPKA